MGQDLLSPTRGAKELKKHASAIHSVNSLSLLQRKICNALLYHAYHDLLTKEVHTISILNLCKILGINSHNYEVIKDAIRALTSTLIEWNVTAEATTENWTASSVLGSANITNGICEYSYSYHLRQLLHSPSVYGRINLIIQSRFKSSYGLALYENCIRYCNLPATRWFTTLEFRKLMGVKEGEYEVFRDLHRRVIKKAVDEVNTYSDIQVEPTYKKVGRQVQEIKFAIKHREKKVKLSANAVPENVTTQEPSETSSEKQELLHRLVKDFGVTQYVADTLVNDYSREYIEAKISLVLSSKTFNSGKITEIAAYLVAAVKKDYKKSKSNQEMISEKHHKAQVKQQRERQAEQRNEEKKRKYNEYRVAYFQSFVKKLDQAMLLELQDSWLEHEQTQNPQAYLYLKKAYDSSGISHPYTRTSFEAYLQLSKYEGYTVPQSMDEFYNDIVE